MFPFNFEWIWDMPHIVFMGGLWIALNIVSAGVVFCILKSAYDVSQENNDDSHH